MILEAAGRIEEGRIEEESNVASQNQVRIGSTSSEHFSGDDIPHLLLQVDDDNRGCEPFHIPENDIKGLVSGRPDPGGSSSNCAANSGFTTSLGGRFSDPTTSSHPSIEPNPLESPAADLAATTTSQTGRLYNYAPTSHACDLSQSPSNLDLLRQSIGHEVYNDGAARESWGIQEDFIRRRPMSGQEEPTGVLPLGQQEMHWGEEFTMCGWPTSAQEPIGVEQQEGQEELTGVLPLEQQEMHWGEEFTTCGWPTSAQEELIGVEQQEGQEELSGVLPLEERLPLEQQEMQEEFLRKFMRRWPTSGQEEPTGVLLPQEEQQEMEGFIRRCLASRYKEPIRAGQQEGHEEQQEMQ
ncbi:hypothetical protein V496_01113 [Pseudogymnoascus sp. VKM F-4515 (FW-2607)]|nr:hypothetical protein V496_01113 [Pseudogymnoascus sp. VKM F-4515 (FW-2607)]